ncbi:MAG: UDP-N-acetylmuramoyl-L-alanyl-D-glutamate--2,6-diaminopimelate ligase [Clostridia bacterium]|nr:UDP-N-acetylmuramoyl-L-alanyl-D-glutamate--2,6-diaminopimelate ligase [Clostridia bacterium]
MLFRTLIERVTVVASNVPPQAEISTITDDNRRITPGCLFVCIAGSRFDGHDAAQDALRSGAAAVVTQRPLGLSAELQVPDTRAAYALLCAAFYGNPADSLCMIGVTGTNGKTTSCFLMADLLERQGVRCGLLGTVKNCIAGEEFPATLTTPDPFELHALLRRMVDAGCTHCVMEASSQALAQRRLEGVRFKAAVFTNLTQDHLDYHGSFENYLEAKRMLFLQTDLAVVNADDDAAERIVRGADCPVVTFSTRKDTADYTAKNAQMHPGGVEYELVGKTRIGRVRFRVPGGFSVYNSMGAIVCLTELGFPFAQLLTDTAAFGNVPGRMEIVPTDTPYTVVIDYAHTPDALENVLKSLREITKGKIFAVFGCGGDRDRTKRPIMGSIAAANADVVIVTSDNPRTEDPEAILDDVMAGIQKPKCTVYRICDRREAIAKAMKKAKEGDVILLAGKGQETYQIIGHEKFHLDEREVVADILRK